MLEVCKRKLAKQALTLINYDLMNFRASEDVLESIRASQETPPPLPYLLGATGSGGNGVLGPRTPVRRCLLLAVLLR